MAWEDIDGFAAQPERAALERRVVAPVLQLHEALRQPVAVDAPADLQFHHHLRIGFDGTDAIDAGHRGDDDDVVALKQGLRGGMPHAVDLLVDLAVLLDIRVGARNIGFRLIVIVVTDEIFHRVVWKKRLHLAVQLCRQGLVGRQDQGRLLHRLDHFRHREGLARAGDAQQHLVALAAVDPRHQIADRGRLVAGRLEFRYHAQPFGDRPGRLALRHEQDGRAGEHLRHGGLLVHGRWRRRRRIRGGDSPCVHGVGVFCRHRSRSQDPVACQHTPN